MAPQSPQGAQSVFDRRGHRGSSRGEPALWSLPKKAVVDKSAGKKPMSARDAWINRMGNDEGEEEDGEMPGDGQPRSEMEAADWAVERSAAEATDGEGWQERDSDAESDGGGGSALL